MELARSVDETILTVTFSMSGTTGATGTTGAVCTQARIAPLLPLDSQVRLAPPEAVLQTFNWT